MKLVQERCTGCAYCVMTCPHQAIITDGWAHIIDDRCTDCNLCLYACPNDCFIPDVAVEKRPATVAQRYDVVVVGAGIGGLMAATALAQAGRSVAVFEKLWFAGGRYTELKYQGVPVTTAAWTSLGPRCHIGRFLSDLGIADDENGMAYRSLSDVGLQEQYSVRFPDGRHYPSIFAMLSPAEQRQWIRAIAKGRNCALFDISAHDYFSGYCDNPDFLATLDALAATASCIGSRTMPASELLTVLMDTRDAGTDFAMPSGGVRRIIDQLERAFKSAGGQLFLRTAVQDIVVQDGRAIGLTLDDGRFVAANVVAHNGGPTRLLALAGENQFPAEYVTRLKSLRGAECAAFFFATNEPMFADAPMLMTPDCRRVVGIFAPSVLDPAMGPPGTYLYDAFLPLQSTDRQQEIEATLADLGDLFPNFDQHLLWYLPMFFTGTWPGTESGQVMGQVGEQRLPPTTPVDGLFLVGMDVQGSGAAGDLIPVGVRKLLAELESPFPVHSPTG